MREITFTPDELVLVLISLVRATNPSILRADADGFTFDFEALDRKTTLNNDEQLLFRIRAAVDSPAPEPSPTLSFDGEECQRLRAALAQLLRVQAWPADVMAICRSLQERLAD